MERVIDLFDNAVTCLEKIDTAVYLTTMMYATTINKQDAIASLLREAPDGSFFAMIVDEHSQVYFTIGQRMQTNGYYQMIRLNEYYIYEMMSGILPWDSDEVWSNDIYTFGDMMSGHFTPLG